MSFKYCYGCRYAKNNCKDAPEYLYKHCTYYNDEEGRIKTDEEVKKIIKNKEKEIKLSEMKAEDRE